METEIVNPSGDTRGWTSTQAYIIAVLCLVLGVAAGCWLRATTAAKASPNVAAGAPPIVDPSAPLVKGSGMGQQVKPQQPTPQELKQMADAQLAPLLRRLKSEPKNAELLADIGNLYYDSQQYRPALEFYQRSLKIQPGNTNVRTDLGLTMWFLGNADAAIQEFQTVLKAEPTKPNALMNLGVVEWQGKKNAAGAIAAWEKLLATNPNFQGKATVEHLIAQVKKH